MTSAGTTREVSVPELRVVAVSNDGTRLVLKAADSTEYTLPIDERLRAAIRGDRPRLGQIEIEVESHLRPRDIQARIRAGASAEEVAQAAGISVDRVRRFEGPVLAERAFMAERARKTAIRRHGEAPGPQLGEAVSERLALRGAEKETERWDSWRRDDGTWEVILSYRADGEGRSAAWTYDPPRRLVQPNDDEARALIGESVEREEDSVFPFIPRIARLPHDRPLRPMIDRPSADRIMSSREVRESREATAESRDSLTSLLDVVPAFRGDLAVGAPPPVEPAPAEVAQEEAEPAAAAPAVGAGSAYADILMPRAVAPHRERLVGTTDRQAEADGVRPGRRATVPSWDEIVFGSRRKKQE
ncbi:septation protein SepH [Kitasatospora purpeofusca]|uniref:septation protein SepH n=1 Tax=Kitasatospora purpeofusca TaxID=67352 RepID=UPI0022549B9F|nr:septation protein SepH [Kitasatospora purpeofusca]MCX4757628.1 septation protein SepH [Kitasatospora purpeofusca]WSR34658.1 septation protein SepH [Kitasatospora purpeofusca]WSR42868.1 septation protein SepH [Kitasatospora purpeofusca]